jgi:hypothetical protein
VPRIYVCIRNQEQVGLCANLVLVEPGVRPHVRGTLRRGEPIYWDGAMTRRMMPAYSAVSTD